MSKTFLHSGARGDIIYSLPTIKALGGGILYISLDTKYYKSKPMDQQDFEWFKELLVGQDYLEDVKLWQPDTHIDYDLNQFRTSPNSDLLFTLLTSNHLNAFNATFDLSQPWLDCTKIGTLHKADIIINRSLRYHAPFSWNELFQWQNRCLFVGMPDEYADFIKKTGLVGIPHYNTCSYRQLTQVIVGSKLFVGNQSFPFALAEAIKCPRVLEACPICPNCMPQSENGYTRLTQGVLRHYLLGEPYQREPSMTYCMSKIGVKTRCSIRNPVPNITYILGNADPEFVHPFLEKASRDKSEVKWIIPGGDYKGMANAIAKGVKSKTICVVDMALMDDYVTARRVAELLSKLEGIAGIYVKQPYVLSDSCFAVSRKAYEECGLFNMSSCSGVAGIIERYARKRYPLRSAGTL